MLRNMSGNLGRVTLLLLTLSKFYKLKRSSTNVCTNLVVFICSKQKPLNGLQIEFYQTFWNSVGELLVESFNGSYIKGEMSPSQRQAVITLIEKKDQDRCELKNC